VGDGDAARADIVILGESFVRLPAAVHAGRASSRLSFLSVVVHFSLRLLLILLALLGVCPPLLASVLLTAAAGASFLFASWFFSRL
jgi:cation transport ATPase